MAVFMPEPHALAIARSPSSKNFQDENIDYRMLPRSSGDGMEHAGNHAEPTSNSFHLSPSNHSYSNVSKNRNTENTAGQQYVFSPSSGSRTERLKIHGNSPKRNIVAEVSTEQIKLSETHNNCTSKDHINSDVKDLSYHKKDSFDYTRKNTSKSHEDLLLSKEESKINLSSSSSKSLYHTTISYLEDEPFEDTNDEHVLREENPEETILNEEVSKLQNTIKDLEERNNKLVEDKTKLCVQLGYQTEVNSELKKLVVAAVGEDLENSLEALLMKNAQNAVEIKHWKTLSEEYAEESDKLAIECDVWRTKFMASRMMSDELSSWKTTLYTKYKQAQSAIQRILNEREELKKYLIKTKRLLHLLGDSLNHFSLSNKHSSETFNEKPLGQQSVLELASVINCLVQDLNTSLIGEMQSLPVLQGTLALSENSMEKQDVEPTPGEKYAIQVLTSDVELHTDEQSEDSTVLKRLGKQYIGNSYQSRLVTNSFRVTFDCCDRCKGVVQVV